MLLTDHAVAVAVTVSVFIGLDGNRLCDIHRVSDHRPLAIILWVLGGLIEVGGVLVLVMHAAAHFLFVLHLLLFLQVELINLHLLDEFVEVDPQLNLLLRRVSEGKVFKSLYDDIALIWVNFLLSRCLIDRVYVR